MVSTFVSPGELIGCDDVEPGNPYNLTVLHSLCNATLYTLYIFNNTAFAASQVLPFSP